MHLPARAAFLVASLSLSAGRAEAQRAGDRPSCAGDLEPVLASSVPPAWLPSEEGEGPCAGGWRDPDVDEPGSESTVVSGRSSEGPFTVTFAGPTGSGRYWEARVTFPSRAGVRGFCFVTSTVGWRHVGGDRPLARRLLALLGSWVRDVDGDGRDELIVPSSVPLSPGASLLDHAMTATVFQRVADRFVLDARGTLALRRQIGRAYRERAASTDHPPARDDRDHFRQAARLLARSCRGGG